MLARRMLAFTLVLLILGMGAAALTPRELREGTDTQTTTAAAPSTTSTTPPASSGGTTAPITPEAVRAVAASPDDPPLVRGTQGDLLELAVSVDSPTALRLSGYETVEEADPASPARFSLLLYLKGRFEIRRLDDDRTVAELLVS